MDLVAAMLILYFTLWLGRTRDFELTMGLFFVAVLAALPLWVRLAAQMEKAAVFATGALWWAAALALIVFVAPDWPRWLAIGIAVSGAIGYAVMDLMPWSMLGEVVDEDDLETGERREGTYYGLFMFVRKLAGSVAVWFALTVLGLLGYTSYGPQTAQAITATRWLASIVPAGFLVLAAWIARHYRLSRARHQEILGELAQRGAAAEPAN
jgi:GPH family glycoside/pentoside/hexuronide:cation symporter